jgi:UDP-2-acetamido-2-deoxy-ribo-hexuluronate aminotransferase
MSTTTPPKIAFIDLQAQRKHIGQPMNDAIMAAVESGAYIMGPPVMQLESELAAFVGSKHCLSCANGTEALVLPLMAWGLKPRDAVFCPSFTFAATAEVVPWLGSSCVFVDVLEDTFNMDPASLEAAIQATLAEGKLVPKVVIAVCLFGLPANYPAIRAICDKYGLKLIADSAQGFGGKFDGQDPTAWADVTTTSFFPAKPLGCYGDGGAVFTNDDELMEYMVSVRVHGQATKSDMERTGFTHEAKYLNLRVGMNSRLDTIQAAVLLEKLKVFPEEIVARNKVAAAYAAGLKGVTAPQVPAGCQSVWAQYTVKANNRDALLAHLKAKSVPTAVYYPIPIHKQPPYAKFSVAPGGLPVTEQLADQVFSLPMHPYLSDEHQSYIIEAVNGFNG